MAKSKVQFIDSLIAEVTKLSMTDDNALFSAKQFISDKLDGYRATVLRKYMADKRNDLSGCYQKIDCLDVKSLGVSCEIEGILIESSTDIMVVEVPELLSSPKAIKYFGTYDLKNNYQKTTIASLSNSETRWGRRLKEFVRIGDAFYFQKCDGTLKFTLIGIFSNPSIVCGFQDTSPYPLPMELEQQLELLVKKDLYQMLGLPIDILNDAADNYQTPQPKQQEDGRK